MKTILVSLTMMLCTCLSYGQVRVCFYNASDSSIDLYIDNYKYMSEPLELSLKPHQRSIYYRFVRFSKQPGFNLSCSNYLEIQGYRDRPDSIISSGYWEVAFYIGPRVDNLIWHVKTIHHRTNKSPHIDPKNDTIKTRFGCKGCV